MEDGKFNDNTGADEDNGGEGTSDSDQTWEEILRGVREGSEEDTEQERSDYISAGERLQQDVVDLARAGPADNLDLPGPGSRFCLTFDAVYLL